MARKKLNDVEWLYTGRVSEERRKIVDDGLVVAPLVYIVERRVEGAFLDTYIDCGDALLEHPDGRYKIVLDALSEREFEDWGSMQGGEFVLHKGVYEKLRGIEFAAEARSQLNRDYRLAEALEARVWKVGCRHSDFVSQEKAWDTRLLEQYCRRVVFPRYEEAMGAYFDVAPEKPRLRAVCVVGLGGWSQLCDRFDFDSVVVRQLVEVAPEALEAARQRSFELCERLANETYPELAGEGNVAQRNASQEQAGVRGSSAARQEAGRSETREQVESERQRKIEAKSESGFLPEKKYDIEVADGAETYVPATELANVLGEIEQGGKLTPEARELILRRVVERKREGQ